MYLSRLLFAQLLKMPRPVALKRDADQEQSVQIWIQNLLGEKWPVDTLYEEALKDGIMLAKVMNILVPGSIPKIKTKGSNFKMMENINMIQKAMVEYGVAQSDIFQTNDLWEKRDLGAVTNTLFALDRAVGKHTEWTGPRLNHKIYFENN